MEDGSARVLSFSLLYVRSRLHSLHQTPYDANRYDYEEWFHNFTTHRPIFLTGVFNNYIRDGYGERNIAKIVKTHTHFFNDLHRQIYKKSKRRVPRIVVIERGTKNDGFHSHIVIETPEHLSKLQFYRIMKDAWGKTKHGVNLHIVDGYDKNGLDRYCSKQLGGDEKSYSKEDNKNCCL